MIISKNLNLKLHDGNRMERRFDENESCKNLYLWVASSKFLLNDQVFLGFFVIVYADGTEVKPTELISDLKEFCYNVRLI